MIPLIKNLEVLNLQRDKQQWRTSVLETEIHEDPRFEEPSGFGVIRKYELSAKIGVEFYANNAQMDGAVVQAKKLLASRLFGDALLLIQEIRSATMNNDAKEIMKLCDELEELFSAT